MITVNPEKSRMFVTFGKTSVNVETLLKEVKKYSATNGRRINGTMIGDIIDNHMTHDTTLIEQLIAFHAVKCLIRLTKGN